ncbi:hypothetical protein BU26DRAFT_504811 [Trematosphaeria pertusa]|uniref:Uncharacterized protein n=1 Tax=Trematosphaeria pertusa TaxID=390896 RepID=A0A6A6IEL8_9PLEO|nr:uncharacterized protein BU26DRAFT_504811 [Trematosphaeria pertusa]KAF2248639.1 hypothetical protein BU26DRAFT_504811 [Trematosphaeria pertusa]
MLNILTSWHSLGMYRDQGIPRTIPGGFYTCTTSAAIGPGPRRRVCGCIIGFTAHFARSPAVAIECWSTEVGDVRLVAGLQLPKPGVLLLDALLLIFWRTIDDLTARPHSLALARCLTASPATTRVNPDFLDPPPLSSSAEEIARSTSATLLSISSPGNVRGERPCVR